MKKEEKDQFIDSLAEQLKEASSFYLTDTSALNADTTSRLRRTCFRKNVQMQVVKNTLLHKAMERSGKPFEELYPALKGPTSIMFSEVPNDPAKMIKEFRKTAPKPLLKGAYVEECVYLGDSQLDALINIKSKFELIGDLIGLLQSPTQNVISALQSGGNKLSGIVKTLSEKPE
ncbi:MAG TPA: 50S ribosomal protein L10 [Bacteroidales bacterium]|nr:50S ribosomal protein L10 [Bacteroidales bacterium]